jgi:hypothetical protein
MCCIYIAMSKLNQWTPIVGFNNLSAEDGVISGVCVMKVGEAKGHGVKLDKKTLETFLELTTSRPDGIGLRFGADHEAGAQDFAGTLRNFRIVNDALRADLHLLKSDGNFSKIIEMSQKMPNEFGLSVVADAEKDEKGDKFKDPLRFVEINCVDIVTNPAATNGLFFDQTNNKSNMKNIALALGLPETATEAEITAQAKVALEKMCKYDADAKKKLDAEADGEEEGKEGKKPKTKELSAIEAALVELSEKVKNFEASAKTAAESSKKAVIEGLKLEASRDGKVIPVSDETLMKLSEGEVKEMISKLPKAQVKLSRGFVAPKTAEGKTIERNSSEHKAFLASQREAGAIALGQRILAQSNQN